MGSSAAADQPAPDKLRHVESISELPSGARNISGINAVLLGESLADEEHDLVFPSPNFSASALVSSPKQGVRSVDSDTERISVTNWQETEGIIDDGELPVAIRDEQTIEESS